VEIVIKSRHCEIKERFRQHIVDKLARLEKLDSRVIRVDVEVSREQNPRLAEVAERVELTVQSRGPVIRAEAAAPDKYAALDIAMEKLETRLRKVVERRRDHRRGRGPAPVVRSAAAVATTESPPGAMVGGEASTEFSSGEAFSPAEHTASVDGTHKVGPLEVQGDGPPVVREKTHRAKPMSLDQALYEMELVGHDFYLFVDADTHQPSVVYRRHGYDYGVIHLVIEESEESSATAAESSAS
jgi:ribosomal subunit interface protein